MSRLRPQPFATVRDRSQAVAWAPYGSACGKFYKSGRFWRFPMPCSLVSRGRRGTSWHSDVFGNVSKVVLCGRGDILLRRFKKMRRIFRGRRSTLATSIVILRARRSTLDVSCCVFLRIALSGLRQVATRCKLRGGRGILWDVLKIDGSLARNIDFAVANVEVHKKTRRKTSILKLQL